MRQESWSRCGGTLPSARSADEAQARCRLSPARDPRSLAEDVVAHLLDAVEDAGVEGPRRSNATRGHGGEVGNALVRRVVVAADAVDLEPAERHPARGDTPELERPVRVERAVASYVGDRYRGLALFDESLEVVESIKQQARVGLITNGPSAIQRDKLLRLEITELFPFVLVSE